LVDDPKWELAILGTAHSFYRKLLEDFLGEELLVPKGLEADAISQPDMICTTRWSGCGAGCGCSTWR